ncbi:MAG: VC_2705 family sodium/solute symporter, partial [Pseudomonadota bacterium]
TLGGMKGVTYTQVVQYCVMIFAYTVPAIFISFIITGNVFPQLGFISNVRGEDVAMLSKLNTTLTDLGFAEYTSTNKSMFDMFAITGALMFGTAGLPHVIIRFFTVKNAKAARYSAGWALIFIALLYTTAPAVGAFARLNFVDQVDGATYISDDANYEAEAAAITAAGGKAVPAWYKTWEQNGYLPFEDKNGDGIMQYRGPNAPDGIANEVDPNRDIFVLANPQIAGLPGWVIGLVVAGGLAAALSTAAGLLMVIASAVSHDLCRRTLFPKMTDKTELRVARFSSAGAVLAAGLLGIFATNLPCVAQVVAFAFGLAAASLFPIIVLGIFWSRMNKEGAIAAMLTGLITTFSYIVYFKFMGGTQDQWLFGVSPEGIGFVFMFLSAGVGIVTAFVTAPPPQDIVDLVNDIRVPGTRKPHGIADEGMEPDQAFDPDAAPVPAE